MAQYFFTGQATWPGAWASVYTDATSRTTPGTAFDIHTWIEAGSITSGDTVTLLGEYPLTLTDTADFVANTVTATTEILGSGATNRANNGAHGRNILFGDVSAGASSVDGISFTAEGDSGGYNVDMRGATSNDDRQSAALYFQGSPTLIDGFKIRPADFNYIQTGGIAAVSTDYATDFYENIGILVRGAGANLEIKNCVVNGGTRCTWGIKVQYRASATPTVIANRQILIHDNICYNCGEGAIEAEGGAGINASSQEPQPNNGRIAIYNNLAYDAWWGDPGANAALDHGNLIAVYGGRSNGSIVEIFNNELYGTCQDAIVSLAVNSDIYDNYIHDINPGLTDSQSVNMLTGVGGGSTASGYASGWDVRSNAITGVGIKLSLGDGYNGTASGSWLGVGDDAMPDSGGTYKVDDIRIRCFRNVIEDNPSYAISANGSSGHLIFGNEISNPRGRGITSGANRTTIGNMWVAHNYVDCLGNAFHIFDYMNCFAYNNAFKGTGNSAVKGGSNSNVYGSNNVIQGTTSGTLAWTNTTAATLDYTYGVGPTASGNCDGTGEWWGILGARSPNTTKTDIAGNRWSLSNLSVGPRQVQ
jgi:hypothetical protein